MHGVPYLFYQGIMIIPQQEDSQVEWLFHTNASMADITIIT